MDLFNDNIYRNLLPYDGEANYYGRILSLKDAQYYFDNLLKTIEWKNDEAIVFGKRIITKRKVAWYGNENYSYTYSKTTKQALGWTSELLQLKSIIEGYSKTQFNSCLLNLYHSGEEGMAWHSDSEKSLGKNTIIASMSFGADRNFTFKHKTTNQKVGIILEKGSLLIMKSATQSHWLHRLPPTKKVKGPRINLTFRTIIK